MTDSRLTYDGNDIVLFVVWSLKPGQPQIIVICSSEEKTENYRLHVEQYHQGMFYVEKVLLDHAFGRRDIQTMMYRAANRDKL